MSDLPTTWKTGDPNPAAALDQTNAQVNADTAAIAAMAPGSNDWLIAITNASAFSWSSVSHDGNGAITTANVTWPDGTSGLFTTTTASTVFLGAVDAFRVTYGSKTITQSAVTRDSAGNITSQPTLTVA